MFALSYEPPKISATVFDYSTSYLLYLACIGPCNTHEHEKSQTEHCQPRTRDVAENLNLVPMVACRYMDSEGLESGN